MIIARPPMPTTASTKPCAAMPASPTSRPTHSPTRMPFPSSCTANPTAILNCPACAAKIKRIQARLADLDKLQAAAQQPDNATKFDGGEIVRNAEENRLQILFDEIPDADTRDALKSNGFRWSPRNKAWQRQLTQNAEYAARRVLGL